MDSYTKNIINFNRQLNLRAINLENLAGLSSHNQKPDALVVAGMGGSGMVGNLLQNLSHYVKLPVPVFLWKDFGLPPQLPTKRPLCLFISFSGSTQETISGFKRARELKPKPKIAVVSGGGELGALARNFKIPLALFSKGTLVPRQANGLMFYGALGILKHIWPQIQAPDLSKKINPKKFERLGFKLAKKIGRKTILVYTSSANSHLGYHFKTRLNETGKTLAFSHTLPELNHNEITGFELKPKNLITLYLADDADAPKIKSVFPITLKLIKKFGTPWALVKLTGKTALEKTMNAIVLADWVSYGLAKIKKINPEKNRIVEMIKELTH